MLKLKISPLYYFPTDKSKDIILPDDIIFEIILRSKDCMNILLTNKYFYGLVNNDNFWLNMYDIYYSNTNFKNIAIHRYSELPIKDISLIDNFGNTKKLLPAIELYKLCCSFENLYNHTNKKESFISFTEKIYTDVYMIKNVKSINNRLFNHDIHKYEDLESLIICDTELTILPASISNIKNILNLYCLDIIRNKNMKFLPNELSQITNINKLVICDSPLLKDISQIFNMTWLTDLILSGLELEFIPKEIDKMVNLDHLSFSDNKIITIPDEIICLENLRTLNLSYNRINKINPKLYCLWELKYLVLDNNLLTKLSPKLGQMFKLQYLSFTGNNIERIPPSIIKSPKITYYK